jgi:DNA-directed RNA polymerase I, II, and III subunit RPABC2
MSHAEEEPIYSSDDDKDDDESFKSESENEVEDEEQYPETEIINEKDDNSEDDEEENEQDDEDETYANGNQTNLLQGGALEGEEDDDDDDDNYQSPYLQKFDADINKSYILDFHPECSINNYDEISLLTKVVRDNANNIIDELHKTIPFLTKYERTRVIGQRAKQINSGAKAFVKVPENVIDGYLIAELELMQKRVPFIIRRPTPGGGCEYWNLKDLEIISF